MTGKNNHANNRPTRKDSIGWDDLFWKFMKNTNQP